MQHYRFTVLLLLLFTSLGFSQTLTLKGTIQDPDGNPLESATVYLTSVKDSSVVDYTISTKNGNWELKTKKITQPVYLKVSYVSFKDYKQELQNISESRDFGIIKLEDQPQELDQVVIEGEIPPIRIKNDTLEFNAASFKVRPDANVEALLKQLPGVEIDDEGKITHNGKEVNEILVGGKSFFGKDGKIALQNLPAEIIDKVQVSDKKTEAEKLSGQKASGDNATINLTIQKDKNKGLFGKFMGGYGSDRRYESSGLLNYFKDKQRFSFLGSSNNINSSGFSMDELFDNMGGGRSSVWISDNGSYGINGQYFDLNTGITRTNLAGLNYNDTYGKDTDVSGSYFFSSSTTENQNRSRTETLLPLEEDRENPGNFINNNFVTNSQSTSKSERFSHTINTEFVVKPDSTSTLSYRPRFTSGTAKQKNTSSQVSVDENAEILNESNGVNYNETDNSNFSSNLNYYKSFSNKKRAIGVSFDNENQQDDAVYLNRSATTFYNPDEDNTVARIDIRDQLQDSRIKNDDYNLGVEYFEPVLDSTRLKLRVEYDYNKNTEDRITYDYDAITGDYTSLNELLTNYLTSTTKTVTPTAGLSSDKEKFNYGFNLGTAISSFNNFSSYLGQDYNLNKNYIYPAADAFVSLRLGKSRNVRFNYSYNVNFPQARQLLPVEDLSNPLFTSIGNPNLDPTQTHSINISMNDFDYAKRSGYHLWMGTNFQKDEITNFTVIDESAKRTTTYSNINGTFNSYIYFNWSKSVKKEAHTFRMNVGINGNVYKDKGFTNAALYEAMSYGITPKLGFSYDYGEILTISPTYRFTYNLQDYENYFISSASNYVHRFNLQTTSYWPKHFVFGNDFQYTYNSNIGSGFRKDFYLWNTSLGYNFLDDKLLFKVKVYDLLNQNLGTSRTITATSIYDQENTVLKRYVMFSLTYKLEKFGAKEKKRERHFFMW